jgi:6,7-dimethyl-8-ribityllumazine synthase
MPKTIEGKLTAQGCKFLVVASRFNRLFTEQLAGGAVDCLVRHGAKDADIHIAWVPGAFEIPATVRRALRGKAYDGIIPVGVLIRGETPHFDLLSGEVAKGLAALSLEAEVPLAFGVLTCDTMEQAMERSSAKQGNKGWDAALSVIEVINLWKEMNAKKA